MLKYTVKRLLQSLVTIFLIATAVFLMMRCLPTDYYFTEEQLMKFTDLVNEGKQIVDDNDARYAAFAKAEALFLEEDLTCPTVYDVSWCLTHANEYSKINAMYGPCNYKAVNWETSEEAYTTVQYEQFAKAFDLASQG